MVTPFSKIPSIFLTLSSKYFKINRSLAKRVSQAAKLSL